MTATILQPSLFASLPGFAGDVELEPPSDLMVAPFPWFGGKRRVASIVWRAFGHIDNYVEAFDHSMSVNKGRG